MKIAKLHSAARQYCEERHAFWANKYSKICKAGRDRVGKSYTKEALSVFPRYNVLAAILEEIERFIPEDFSDFNEARSLIAEAGSAAETIFTEPPHGKIEKQVMDEERAAFTRYINEISDQSLESVQLLPFRKVLLKKESSEIWKLIKDAWELPKGYWYPLIENKPSNVEAFQDIHFERNISNDILIKFFKNRGIMKFWELREYGAEYEMDIEIFEPYYNGAEGFWTSSSFDWIVYCSHESSVSVGGWLLDEVKQSWPDWEKYLWTSPFFK
jgi:hypothetical protein